MGGSSTLPARCAGSTTAPCGQPGVYGTVGSAATANIPGGRSFASFWTDSGGNFWLFGGYGFDADQMPGELNDLWEFNPTTKEWTWTGGSGTVGSNGGQPGVYGDLGSAAVANLPGGRDSATSWIGNDGQFWLYGGEGYDSQGNSGQLDDLWAFDLAAHEWTWMGGSSTLPALCAGVAYYGGLCGWPADYGMLGVAAPGIGPGSRLGAAGWTDNNGNLWLFGGQGSVYWEERDFSEIDQYDLWEFNPSTLQWAWMSGNSTSICGESSSENWCGQDGIYDAGANPSIANIPPSRSNATSWTDADGNLWLFAGAQAETTNIYGPDLCNDVWVYLPASNEWGWEAGAGQWGGYSCFATPGNYGTLGMPLTTNTPGGRFGAASWIDTHGNLWIFGGYTDVDMNDLWTYEPVAPIAQPSFEVIASPNPVNIGAIGTDVPTVTSGTTTVSILVADGYASPFSLAATTDTCNGITCVTGNFSPTTLVGAGSSTLTISVYGTVSIDGVRVINPGPVPLTITATSGSFAQSIQVIVDVTDIGEIAPPIFSVPTGTYSTAQTVSITDVDLENTGEFIYYTIDGTTPTASSAVYVNPITVASTTTLKAIALLFDEGQSPVTSATYTFVPPSPNFSITGTAVSVAPGATTGNTSTITLTPSNGFTGAISLSCAIIPIAASDPATCNIPASVTINGSTAETGTLTVNTTPATSAFNGAEKFFRPLVEGTALASILLIGIPARRRRWRSILSLLVMLFSLMGAVVACSGGGSGDSGGGGGGGNPGTTPGTYTITVTGTSGAITETGSVILTVQ